MTRQLNTLSTLMADLEEEQLIEAVSHLLEDKNVNALAILDECREGIRIVGERFEQGEYFISDLIMSGELFKGVLALLEPLLAPGAVNDKIGTVVFGTVKGDIHNIGKDIVESLLKADGFEVFDLGVDQPPEAFVEKVRETGARIVGLSGLIPVSYDSMKETIEALQRAGLKTKVMIGGSLVDDSVMAYTGADGWGNNAITAVNLCRKFAKEV